MADKLSPLQQALRGLPLEQAMATLEIMEKLIRNVVSNSKEEKYRRIKLSNPKISAAITEVKGAVELLKEMGWIEHEDCLVLPADVTPKFEIEVHGIIEARDWYKKEDAVEKKTPAFGT